MSQVIDQREPRETEEPGGQGSENENVYDNVFQTIVHYMPQLMIPLINYAFGTSYPEEVPFLQMKNELMTKDGKLITDSVYLIEGVVYHIECESSAKTVRVILRRMLEYDFSIALRGMDEDSTTVQLPTSCVVYLRHRENTPDQLELKLQNPQGDSIPYRVRVVKAQKLSLEEVFDRELLLLLPYYLMRYEKEVPQYEKNEAARENFLRDVAALKARMEQAESSGEKYAVYERISELIVKVADHILRKQPKAREGVEQIMGGHPYELRTQKAWEAGIEKGREEGEKKGRIEGRIGTYVDLIRDRVLSVSDAARRLDLTPAEFAHRAADLGLTLP